MEHEADVATTRATQSFHSATRTDDTEIDTSDRNGLDVDVAMRLIFIPFNSIVTSLV
jgi:hypothetical protein